jgi:hypothetical protein
MAFLPPLYRVCASRESSQKHLAAITTTLLSDPRIEWGKARTPEVIARQVTRAWSCICVLKGNDRAQGAEEELVGFARVISDGEG